MQNGMMKYLIMIFAALSFTGCTTYKPAEEAKIENEKVFAQSFDKVWAKTVSFVSANGMHVKTIDKASGLIVFEKAYDPAFASRYIDCGRMMSIAEAEGSKTSADKNSASNNLKVNGGDISMNFYIEKLSGDKTKMRINTFGKIIMGGGTALGTQIPTTEYPCYSNGNFEQQVFTAI